MARMLASGITAEYAGAQILSESEYLAEDVVELSRSFTTTAEAVIEAAAPVIRAHGNAQGEYTLGVQVDFADKPSAMAALLERVQFAEAHQTGELRLTVGSTVCAWMAGLSGVQGALSLTPGNKMRMTVQYAFVLGAEVPTE